MIRIVIALLVAAGAVFAQNRASISGEVTDSTGAHVANAKVVATSVDTNIATTATTNSSGIYVIQNLEIGAYIVTAEREGFRRFLDTVV